MQRKVLYTIIILIFLTSSFILAAENQKVDNKKTSMIKVTSAVGEIKLNRNGKWEKVKQGMNVLKSDVIKIGKNSKMRLTLNDGSAYSIMGEKEIKVADLVSQKKTAKKSSLKKLLSGALGKLKKNSNGNNITAVAGVRGDDVANQKAKVDESEVDWDE